MAVLSAGEVQRIVHFVVPDRWIGTVGEKQLHHLGIFTPDGSHERSLAGFIGVVDSFPGVGIE